MSATPPRHASPFSPRSNPQTPNFTTPAKHNVLFRTPNANGDSPTSTLSESIPNNTFRLDNLPKAGQYSTNAGGGTTSRRIIIRADPSLLTCFDPSDRELYDLWAPQR